MLIKHDNFFFRFDMIFNIPIVDYALTGLDTCCDLVPASSGACTTAKVGGVCPEGTTVSGGTGIYACNVSVAGAGSTPYVATAAGGCVLAANVGTFITSTFVPSSTTHYYTSTGTCTLSSSAISGAACGGIPITQSIDMCNLVATAYAKLAPDTLNMYGNPYGLI